MNQSPEQVMRELRRRIDMPAATPTNDGGSDQAAPLAWPEWELYEVHDDYLVCKAWDGTVAFGELTNIAKDPELRVSTYDGRMIDHDAPIGELDYTYTGPKARTVEETAGSTTQDQIIIPDYVEHVDAAGEDPAVAGSIITAVPAAVSVRNDADDDGVWCQWREVTQRAWANVE